MSKFELKMQFRSPQGSILDLVLDFIAENIFYFQDICLVYDSSSLAFPGSSAKIKGTRPFHFISIKEAGNCQCTHNNHSGDCHIRESAEQAYPKLPIFLLQKS